MGSKPPLALAPIALPAVDADLHSPHLCLLSSLPPWLLPSPQPPLYPQIPLPSLHSTPRSQPSPPSLLSLTRCPHPPASSLSPAAITLQAIPYGELVDLRMEVDARRVSRLQPAERATSLLHAASGRLSLRDPALNADARAGARTAMPCNFTEGSAGGAGGAGGARGAGAGGGWGGSARPSIRLGCPGHPSWRTRDEPRYERDCRRVDGLAAAHDAAFMI